MAEYIDRETLITDMKKRYCTGCNSYNGVRCRACWVDDATGEIDDAPAANVAPVVHGRWIAYDTCRHVNRRFKNPEKWAVYKCSVCEYSSGRNRKNYCPNCGAKMDGA